jgi:transposase
MRTPRPIDEKAKGKVAQLLRQTKSKSDFQRVQCVWLRARLGLSSEAIAQAVGWSPGRVRQIWSRYFTQGEGALLGVGRGGRFHENLTRAEEADLLAALLPTAQAGGVLVVSEIQARYEQRLGRPVPKSTIYRMLARHGWRKIAPRPRHPQSDPSRQAAFKKTSTPSLSRRSGGRPR